MWLLDQLQENYEVPVLLAIGLLCIWWYRKLSKDHEDVKRHDEERKRSPKKSGRVTFKASDPSSQNGATAKTSETQSSVKEDKVDNLTEPVEALALYRAVKVGDVEEVRSLLSKNADPNIPDRDQNTSYHILFQDISTMPVEEASMILEMILRNGLKLNPKGLNSLNRDGKTPLHLAVRNTTPDLVRLLLKYGADRTIPDKDGNTPLHTIIEYMQFSQMPSEREILDLLLQDISAGGNDADLVQRSGINLLNEDNMTPLHQAVMYEETDNVRVLLENGADPNIPDSDGNTPLHTLLSTMDQNKELSSQNRTLLTLLLDAKANALAENRKGESPLFLVTDPEIEELFLNT